MRFGVVLDYTRINIQRFLFRLQIRTLIELAEQFTGFIEGADAEAPAGSSL